MITEIDFENIKQKLSTPTTGELYYESIFSIKKIGQLINPVSILELGFNRGVSCIMWLENTHARIHSLDIRPTETVNASIEYITQQYPSRFTYTTLNHEHLSENRYISLFKNKYDTIFIDGDHSYSGIYRDILNCLNFNPKYMVFDDYLHTTHSKDIKNAIVNSKCLKILEEYNTSCGHVLTENLNYIK